MLEAKAYTSQEAVDLNVVDFIAEDVEEMLELLDGRTVETAAGAATLATLGLDVRRIDMSFVERFLLVLSDPNISFILLTVGGLGIMIELFNPGLVVPGVVGVICLLLAFLAMGNLPVNWAGVAFLILAMALLFMGGSGGGLWNFGRRGYNKLYNRWVAAVQPLRRSVSHHAVGRSEPMGAAAYGCLAAGRWRLGLGDYGQWGGRPRATPRLRW